MDCDRQRLQQTANFSLALFQLICGLFARGDITGDPEPAHRLTRGANHNRTLDRNPAFPTRLSAIGRGEETVFDLATAAPAHRRRKSGVEFRQVIGMDEAARLRQGLGQVVQTVAVNAPVARVAFEATRLGVNTPHPEFCALESQLQAIVAILQCRLIVPSFGEQGGEYERTR